MVLAGCMYFDPINRRPDMVQVDRVCDGADPAAPCDLSDLHHGDRLALTETFHDQDSPGDHSVVQWQVTPCDSTDGCRRTIVRCDGHQLYEGNEAVPSFVVPGTLKDGGPVTCLVVELKVFDNRGALAPGYNMYAVHDGPSLVLRRGAFTTTLETPIDLFATYGDPDEAPQQPPEVTLRWSALGPSENQASLSNFDVSQDPADPAHVTVGKRFVPMEVGPWDVRVRATNAHDQTDESHLRFTVEPPPLQRLVKVP